MPPERHVVLVHPEIHWNTGNIGRTCLGTGATLHLLKPLGFSIDDRSVKRAGLDYWHAVDLRVWESYDFFCEKMQPDRDEIALFSKSGKHSFWNLPQKQRLFLVFGSETRGLPDAISNRYDASATYYIPISSRIRSLNLSSAVAAALYESIRFAGDSFHGWSA